MRVVEKTMNGLFVIEPTVYNDSRGQFFESFNYSLFNELIGSSVNFMQDNHSVSKLNVVRGLHLQESPFEQGKLVRVASGRVLDVVVDIRIGSPTFGQSYSVELSQKNNLMMWIPSGFAHGFSVLENNSIFLYKCTKVYNKNSEMTLLYNDADLKIDWRVNNPIISDKDKEGIAFNKFKSPFNYS